MEAIAHKRSGVMIVLFFLLFGVVIWQALYFTRHCNILQKKNEQEKEELLSTIKGLEAGIDHWSDGYSNLAYEIVILQEEKDDLQSEVEDYKLEVSDLQKVVTEYEEKEEETVLKTSTKEETKRQTYTYSTSSLSESEVYMLAQLIYLEGGNTSYECQLAIGSVVLNLMNSDGVSLKTEIFTPGRFSVANSVPYTTPSATSIKAAQYLAQHGTTLPSSVKCFRNNHYFSWCKPYCHIDNVYFGSY